MALFATTTTTTDVWGSCGTDSNSTPCPVSTSSSESSTPLYTTLESSISTASAEHPAPHPVTSSVGYILIGVAIPIVIILIGACIFYWRRRRHAAAAAAAPPPLDPVFPFEKNVGSDAEKGYGDVRLDTAVSELDPGPGGMGTVFIAELDGSSMVGCMELDSSPVMAMSPGAGMKTNLFVSGAGTNASARNSRFSASTGAGMGAGSGAGAGTTSGMRSNGFAGAGTGAGAGVGAGVGAGAGAGVNNNAFIAELEAPIDGSEVEKRLELEGNDAPQITEVEIPSSILFTVKKGTSGDS